MNIYEKIVKESNKDYLTHFSEDTPLTDEALAIYVEDRLEWHGVDYDNAEDKGKKIKDVVKYIKKNKLGNHDIDKGINDFLELKESDEEDDIDITKRVLGSKSILHNVFFYLNKHKIEEISTLQPDGSRDGWSASSITRNQNGDHLLQVYKNGHSSFTSEDIVKLVQDKFTDVHVFIKTPNLVVFTDSDSLKDSEDIEPEDEETSKVCPRCNEEYTGYPALSRKDNKTEICPDCGTAEAFEQFTGLGGK